MEAMGERTSSLFSRVESSVSRRFDSSVARLDSLSARLETLNPRNVLSRGYGLVTDGTGRAVTSVDDIQVGGTVRIHMRDGSASAEIMEKERK